MLHVRLWLCIELGFQNAEAGVAADKSQTRELRFAGVSPCTARPVVKRVTGWSLVSAYGAVRHCYLIHDTVVMYHNAGAKSALVCM